jgi:hypothetical protein
MSADQIPSQFFDTERAKWRPGAQHFVHAALVNFFGLGVDKVRSAENPDTSTVLVHNRSARNPVFTEYIRSFAQRAVPTDRNQMV